jgi:hypothetical protein
MTGRTANFPAEHGGDSVQADYSRPEDCVEFFQHDFFLRSLVLGLGSLITHLKDQRPSF